MDGESFLVSCLLMSIKLNFCSPGRFFAVNELKAMLAYVLLTYDVKTVDGERPEQKWFAQQCVPNPTASVMFRKRK